MTRSGLATTPISSTSSSRQNSGRGKRPQWKMSRPTSIVCPIDVGRDIFHCGRFPRPLFCLLLDVEEMGVVANPDRVIGFHFGFTDVTHDYCPLAESVMALDCPNTG